MNDNLFTEEANVSNSRPGAVSFTLMAFAKEHKGMDVITATKDGERFNAIQCGDGTRVSFSSNLDRGYHDTSNIDAVCLLISQNKNELQVYKDDQLKNYSLCKQGSIERRSLSL